MSKALIFANNSTSQTLANGDVVSFGVPVRRYGSNLYMVGGNVVARGDGYYNADANISFTATAGTATIQAFKDGVAIPGAVATITTAASTSYQVSIPFVIRQRCCVESTITVKISGVTPTVSNASIVVEKE